jgi:outer membrane protein insertion porin family
LNIKLIIRQLFIAGAVVIFILCGLTGTLYSFTFTGGNDDIFDETESLYANFQDDVPPRATVRKVSFEGNDTYSSMVLREIIGTEAPGFFRKLIFWNQEGFDYSENELRRDIIRIRNFYNRRGFLDARVQYDVETGRKSHHRRVTFLITENEPILIDSIRVRIAADDATANRIRDERIYGRALERNPLQEQKRYEEIRFPDVETHFLDVLRDLGYAFPMISLISDVDSLARRAELDIVLNPGPRSYYSSFQVDGEQTVSEEYIIRESDIREGQEFSRKKMETARQELFGHHLFRFATIGLPEQPRDSTVHVLIRVREYPLRSIELRGGFGTEELFRGLASWTHRNPYSSAHRFSATIRASFIEQRANVEYLFPYLFNTFSSFSISPFAQRLNETSYELRRYGVNNSFIYHYQQNLVGTIAYEFSRNNLSTRDVDASLPDSIQQFNVSSLQFSGFYSQSQIVRSQGWAIRPNIEISGFLGTGTLQFEKLSLDIRRFIDFSRSTQLAMRIDSGILFARDADQLPANIRLYTGGSNSVRGWGRNRLGPKRAVFDSDGNFEDYLPTGGSSRLTFNTEIRQDLNFLFNGFGMVAFLDGGQIWSDYSETHLDDFQFGVGGGLRYRSPIGPIRLDLGYKVNPDDQDLLIYNGENYGGRFVRWNIHFSIGHAF